MKKIFFTLSLGLVLGGVACTEDSTKDPNYQPPGGEETPTIYYVTFVADGVTVGKLPFTSATEFVFDFEVPAKEGYIGRWETYTLGTGDITVNAIYEVDPNYQPGGSDDQPKDEVADLTWLVILLAALCGVLVVVLVLLLLRKKSDDEDGNPPATEEEPAPATATDI